MVSLVTWGALATYSSGQSGWLTCIEYEILPLDLAKVLESAEGLLR